MAERHYEDIRRRWRGNHYPGDAPKYRRKWGVQGKGPAGTVVEACRVTDISGGRRGYGELDLDGKRGAMSMSEERINELGVQLGGFIVLDGNDSWHYEPAHVFLAEHEEISAPSAAPSSPKR